MLKSIRIRNLAVVQEAAVEFGAGLNLLTGETGAGKSILVDALGLVGGDRADAGLVRAGSDRGLVEALFRLPGDHPAAAALDARGLQAQEADDGGVELIVRRELKASGGGRVFLNDSNCTLATLREVAGLLLDMHRQHDQQSLLSREFHLRTLDRFGGHGALLERTAEAYRGVIEADRRLQELRILATRQSSRMQELEACLNEIDSAAVRDGERAELESRRRVLRNLDRLHDNLTRLEPLLDDHESSAAARISAAADCVSRMADLDPDVSSLLQQLEIARIEVQDVASQLRDYRASALADAGEEPGRTLEELESRAALLDGLMLKYGADETAVLEHREQVAEELGTLADLDGALRRAGEARQDAVDLYLEQGAELTAARHAAAAALSPAVAVRLQDLAMAGAELTVRFAPASGDTVQARSGAEGILSLRGCEKAEFLLAANPGEPAAPLARAASGGELSRVMLALHGVAGDGGDGGRVLVFDEIDTGVGGAAADRLGARLKALSAAHQVLCVTHLPQVAAYADSHHVVAKEVAGGRTRVDVVALNAEDRIGEVARMIGGRKVTDATRKNAAEMIRAAGRER